MNKHIHTTIGMVFLAIITITLTGCDAKWGGTDPVPPQPPTNNNFSLFGGGSGGGNSTEEKIKELERKLEEKGRSSSSETKSLGEVEFSNAPKPKVLKTVESTVDHWVTVNLPSRERRGMTKKARVKIQIPSRRMTLDERNLAIAQAVDEIAQSGLCAEDLVSLPAGMAPGRR